MHLLQFLFHICRVGYLINQSLLEVSCNSEIECAHLLVSIYNQKLLSNEVVTSDSLLQKWSLYICPQSSIYFCNFSINLNKTYLISTLSQSPLNLTIPSFLGIIFISSLSIFFIGVLNTLCLSSFFRLNISRFLQI